MADHHNVHDGKHKSPDCLIIENIMHYTSYKIDKIDKESISCTDILPCFSNFFFSNGDNFCNFLFASLDKKTIQIYKIYS